MKEKAGQAVPLSRKPITLTRFEALADNRRYITLKVGGVQVKLEPGGYIETALDASEATITVKCAGDGVLVSTGPAEQL